MLLTFADVHAKRPSRNQQIPYDALRSATRPNDISAAHARAPNQMRHALLDDDVAFFRQGNSAKSLQDCRPLIFDDFCGILIDSRNPLTY
jgi:hypothetical protein